MHRNEPLLMGLRWTSRGEVCAELLRYLQQPASAPRPRAEESYSPRENEALLRPRAEELFALLAEEAHIPMLRLLTLQQLALESEDAGPEYRNALVRLKATLPADELRALLDQGFSPLWYDLFRSPEAQNVARQVAEGWPAAHRAWVLTRVGWHEPLRGLADCLYERWLNEERWQLEDVEDFEGPLNRTVAWYTADPRHLNRTESRVILVDYWRRAEGKAREELRERLRDVPAAWVADRPEELRELAESFALAHADLISYYGADRLLQIADEKLRGISRRRRADPKDASPLDCMEFHRLVAVLADWPKGGARERIRSLFACPDIGTDVRWEFCDHLWVRRHEEMIGLALTAGQLAGDRDLVRRVLRWLANEPDPADQPLFWWAAFQEDDWEMPYWAMQGLEHLGEMSQAWHERLNELSRSSHAFLRLQANGALLQRGERERLPGIARAAVEDEDPCVRGGSDPRAGPGALRPAPGPDPTGALGRGAGLQARVR